MAITAQEQDRLAGVLTEIRPRVRFSLRSSRLYFRLAQRIRWRSIRPPMSVTAPG